MNIRKPSPTPISRWIRARLHRGRNSTNAILAIVLIAILSPVSADASTQSEAPAYLASLDGVQPGGVVTGWAFDADDPGFSLDIDARVDGERLFTCDVGIPRPDVATAHPDHNLGSNPRVGFECHMDETATDGTQRTVDVIAFDRSDGARSEVHIGSTSFAVSNSEPRVYTDSVSPGEMTGWAIDLDTPGQSVDVEYLSTIPDVCRPEVESGLPRADVAAHFGVPSTNGDPYGWRLTYRTDHPGCDPVDPTGDDLLSMDDARLLARDTAGNRRLGTWVLPEVGPGAPS